MRVANLSLLGVLLFFQAAGCLASYTPSITGVRGRITSLTRVQGWASFLGLRVLLLAVFSFALLRVFLLRPSIHLWRRDH